MELRRVCNKNFFLIVLLATIASCLLFYQQQIQEGEQEISSTDADYDRELYTIYDVNDIYTQMLSEYIQTTDLSQEFNTNAIQKTKQELLGDNIDKDSVNYKLYHVASVKLKEQVDYVVNYNSEISSQRQQALQMVQIGVFSDPSSYAYNNILKTRYDFTSLENVEVELANFSAIEAITRFHFSGYLLILLILYLTFCFMLEQRNGMKVMIHASAQGRVCLAWKRFVILGLISLFGSFVINGAIFIESFLLYGGWNSLHCSIQSDPLFENCILTCTVGQLLILFIIINAISVWALGLLLYFFMYITSSPTIFAVIFCGILGIETILYRFIVISNYFGVLKYANILSLFQPFEAYTQYINCRIGSELVSRKDLLLLFSGLVILLMLLGMLVAAQIQYPIRKVSIFQKVLASIRKRYEEILAHLPLCLLELHKICFCQKGWFIMIAGVILISGVSINGAVYYDDTRSIMREFYEEVGSQEVNDKVYALMEQYEQELQQDQEELTLLEEKQNRGEQFNYSEFTELTERTSALSNALDQLGDQISYLNELQDTRHIKGQLIPLFQYEYLFNGKMDYGLNMINLYLLIMLIFLISPNIAYEKTNHMLSLIHSSSEGRSHFIRNKILINCIIAVITGSICYGYYYDRIDKLYPLQNLDAGILSLPFMNRLPFNISIKGYLIYSFLIKLILLVSFACMISMVSIISNYKNSIIISCLVLIPHMIYLIGYEQFKYISIVLPFNNWQMLRNFPSSWIVAFLYILSIAIGGCCALFTCYLWNKRMNTKGVDKFSIIKYKERRI